MPMPDYLAIGVAGCLTPLVAARDAMAAPRMVPEGSHACPGCQGRGRVPTTYAARDGSTATCSPTCLQCLGRGTVERVQPCRACGRPTDATHGCCSRTCVAEYHGMDIEGDQ